MNCKKFTKLLVSTILITTLIGTVSLARNIGNYNYKLEGRSWSSVTRPGQLKTNPTTSTNGSHGINRNEYISGNNRSLSTRLLNNNEKKISSFESIDSGNRLNIRYSSTIGQSAIDNGYYTKLEMKTAWNESGQDIYAKGTWSPDR
ncbi:hypothetical protein EDC19_2314 [Natranaerovirga hydrolytica]|uniref:Uncharacterized protein n=1 Tax=Natranaerovirga hydrolytica TaxID=680378 RepID=A0A4R1MEA9_9FIRM|nr:hypothetical protein [Natranaerovirga hydrolytica]TCK90545.1 hypothetical protein EDC19_2314 [Natranaerovirga hydrolytica]